jgi:arabinofuranosyltransferase
MTSFVTAAVVIWAVIAAAELRTPYFGTGSLSGRGFSDEAGNYAIESGNKNPVTIEDYEQTLGATLGARAKLRAERGKAALLATREGFGQLPSRPGLRQPTVIFYSKAIGRLGYAAGPEVHVVDPLSLADPVGSRLRLEQRGRPGHEKLMDFAWAIARFGDATPRWVKASPDCSVCGPRRMEARDRAVAAEQALHCGTLDEVILGVTEPMSLSRFFDNLVLAPRATAVRFAAQPDAAVRELCD